MQYVIVLNGRPRHGKDTLTTAIGEKFGPGFKFMSSIEPVKEMLSEAGIDISQKTPADRKLLADVKAALDVHGNFITDSLLDAMYENGQEIVDGDTHVFVTHIREARNILKLEAALEVENPEAVFLCFWVWRPDLDHEPQSNRSDEISFMDYPYSMFLTNHNLECIQGYGSLIAMLCKTKASKQEIISEIKEYSKNIQQAQGRDTT